MNGVIADKGADLNLLWARLLVEELYRLGVRHFCMAPGSRSTSLTMAVAAHPGVERHVHFDERGLGFLALGLAKATLSPVAIVTTSGTAVANLYPAVVEAYQTQVPLIVLSGDRPPELIDCGANQAIVQPGIFAGYAKRLNLPTPDLAIAPQVLLAKIDAMASDLQQPLHINCMYREPLYPGKRRFDFSDYLKPILCWQYQSEPWNSSPSATTKAFPNQQQLYDFAQARGVIVVGSLLPGQNSQALLLVAQKLGWPILADAQSQLRQSEGAVHYIGQLLHHPDVINLLSQAQNLLLIGGRLISKRLLQFVSSHPWQNCWHWQTCQQNVDPSHLTKQSFIGDIDDLVSLSFPQNEPHSMGWAQMLYQFNELAETQWRAELESGRLTEISAVRRLSELVEQHHALFIGNSLPIRLFDMFASKKPNSAPAYTNRGASGIDGLLATAIGVAKGLRRPLVLVIGDLSLLHDLNSLSLTRDPEQPLVIVVLNNDGGSIFNMLPVPTEQLRQEYYRTPHGLEFEQSAAMFGLSYRKPCDLEDFEAAVIDALSIKKATLIEVKVPPNESAEDITRLAKQVEQLNGQP